MPDSKELNQHKAQVGNKFTLYSHQPIRYHGKENIKHWPKNRTLIMASLTELWEENSDFYMAFGATAGMYSSSSHSQFSHTNFSRFFHCSSINSMVTWFCTQVGFTQIRDPPFGSCLGRVPCSPKSISSSARYVICRGKIWWRRSNVCQFGSGKWFWVRILAHVAVTGERCSSASPGEKSVRNMI
jgi:hypothetical protein